MRTKMVEIRDRATCIPAVAIQVTAGDPIEDRFLWRCGYPGTGARMDGQPSVILMKLNDQKAASDPYDWDDRTMRAAHNYVLDYFDELTHGQVVDARVILGEENEPATPEIWCPEDFEWCLEREIDDEKEISAAQLDEWAIGEKEQGEP